MVNSVVSAEDLGDNFVDNIYLMLNLRFILKFYTLRFVKIGQIHAKNFSLKRPIFAHFASNSRAFCQLFPKNSYFSKKLEKNGKMR